MSNRINRTSTPQSESREPAARARGTAAGARPAAATVEGLEQRLCFAVSFAAPIVTPIGDGPGSVNVADFNGDGKQDAAISLFGDNQMAVLLGNGDGTFAITKYDVAASPAGVSIADFDNDGNLDLLTATGDENTVGSLSVLLGDGAGGFASRIDSPSILDAQSPGVGDFDGDGIIDVAVSGFADMQVSIQLGQGDGTFAAPVAYSIGNGSAENVALADFNEDGNLDVAAPVYEDDAVAVLFGNGDGTLQAPLTLSISPAVTPSFALAADLNADGLTDIATGNYFSTTLSVLLATGPGTFAPSVTYDTGDSTTLKSYPYAVIADDFNGDGIIDLANSESKRFAISILPGKGDGTFDTGKDHANFTFRSDRVNLTLASTDFTGDGKPDIITTDQNAGSFSIWVNASTPSPTADVAPASVTISGPSSAIGGTTKGKATVVVRNGGDAILGGTTTVGLYASADGTFDSGDMLIASVAKKLKVKPGKTAKVSLRYTYPGLPDGAYSIFARTTSDDGSENILNDTIAAGGAVVIAAPFKDLHAISVTASPKPVKAGQSTRVVVQLENLGNTTLSASPATAVVASGAGVADVVIAAPVKKIVLRPSASKKLTFTVKLPSTLAPGSYTLTAQLDSAGSVTESDEDNNLATASPPLLIV